jgi:hypothetical protein
MSTKARKREIRKAKSEHGRGWRDHVSLTAQERRRASRPDRLACLLPLILMSR